MRLLVSAMGALGLALLFSGCTAEAPPGSRRSTASAHRLAQWGLSDAEATKLAVLSSAAGLAAGILVLAATGVVPLAVLAILCVAPAPFALMKARRRRQREEMREAWPDAISSIIAGIRAGMSLAECCCALAERGPMALRSGFKAFADTYRASMSFQAGLDGLRGWLQDPIADRVALVLGLAHEVGGTELVRVLRATNDFIREDLRTRGEIKARWSWTVNAARLAAGTPFVVLILMGLRPEARLAYGSSAGMTTIAVGSLITLLGYRLMLRAARLPEERRLG